MSDPEETAASGRTDCFPGYPTAPANAAPAPVEPLQVPTRRIIVAGQVAWVIALAVTLALPSLHTGDRSWWPWTCVAGLMLGGLGYLYVARGRGNAADAE